MTDDAPAETESTDRDTLRVLSMAMAGLVVFGLGYETRGVIVGDSLNLLFLVSLLGGAVAVFAAYAASDDE